MTNFRKLIDLIESAASPVIDAHREHGTILVINLFTIPKSERGKGNGRRIYEEWEANIPSDITRIELCSADIGDGAGLSSGFWEAMGYDYIYVDDGNIPDTMAYWMWKGVNGNPTPPSKEPDLD